MKYYHHGNEGISTPCVTIHNILFCISSFNYKDVKYLKNNNIYPHCLIQCFSNYLGQKKNKKNTIYLFVFPNSWHADSFVGVSCSRQWVNHGLGFSGNAELLKCLYMFSHPVRTSTSQFPAWHLVKAVASLALDRLSFDSGSITTHLDGQVILALWA